ncbi:unnamed protein product [Bursaphelenchus xylophilus]|uniref:(pine wood nematode) hypothetical protein n=1 Tax=Bursaphelenchus xylophilus TaxID=6326 RepID=A0A7I8X170_BURXY|nr:unnamed protein product [Bursaphelenchus xylophilus]CAG9130369.1 unnamed protein product [Bursaphelenchus xylophilus]
MRNKTLFLGLLSTFFWIQDVQADRADQGLFFPCSLNRRIWDCIGKKTEIPSVDLFKEIASSDSDITHLTSIQSNNRKLLKPVNFYGAYLNKIDPLDGSFHVSARVRIGLRQAALVNATGLLLQIVPNDQKKRRFNYEAKLNKKKEIDPIFTITFLFILENELEYSTNYTLRYAVLPLASGASDEMHMDIPDYKIPKTDCDSEFVEREDRQLQASRWVTSVQEVVYFPKHKGANITFYGAPRSYCIDAYEIQVVIGDATTNESYIVNAEEMIDFNDVMLGNVTLKDVQLDKIYYLRIIPFNSKSKCVCKNLKDCACVAVDSAEFVFPSFTKDITDTYPNQILNVRVVDDRIYNSRDSHHMLIIIMILGTSLGIVSVILALIICRGKDQRGGLFLIMKPSGLSIDPNLDVPLIEIKPSTVLILNAESEKNSYILFLSNYLRDEGVNVYFAPRDVKAIENNLQLWCLKAVQDADKIMFFHSDRMSQLLWAKQTSPDLLNTVFCTLLSMIDFSDKRMIHITWGNGSKKIFSHAEIVYDIPRDLNYLVKAITNTNPPKNIIQNLQDKYKEVENNTNEEPECIKGAKEMSTEEEIHQTDQKQEDLQTSEEEQVQDPTQNTTFNVTKRQNYISNDSGVHMMNSQEIPDVPIPTNIIPLSSFNPTPYITLDEDSYNTDSGVVL